MKTPTNIKSKLDTVTPEWASRQLAITEKAIADGKFIQRNISEAKAQSYARDMLNGHWVPNHQGVAIDEHGHIIDGRHRLRAVVIAGVPVAMTVSTGWPAEYRNGVVIKTMDTIDRGRVRSIGSQLQIDGYKNANNYAACARAIAILCTGDNWQGVTTLQTRTILEKVYLSDIDEIFALTVSAKQRKGYICAPLAMLHHVNQGLAKEFAGKFFSLEGLSSSHPALALHRWLENHQGASNERLTTMKVVCSCMYHFSKGGKLTRVYPNNEAAEWLLNQQKQDVRKICELMGVHVVKSNAQASA